MKFGDVITAVASLFLITVLISYPLETVLISLLGLNWAPTIGALISVLLGGLIIGYVFSGKTADGKKEALVKISILFGYAFRFDRKWGLLTLITYFLNMIFSVLQHYV